MGSLTWTGFLVVTFIATTGSAIVFPRRTIENLRKQSLEVMSASANTFSLELFKKVATENTGNLVSSPLGTSLILSMLFYGANNATKTEIQNVLHLPKNPLKTRIGLRGLVDKLSEYKAVDFEVVNGIFLHTDKSPESDFRQEIRNGLRGKLYTTDMLDPLNASKAINDWSHSYSHGHVKDVVETNTFGSEKKLLLLSVAYFRGIWPEELKSESIAPRDFFLNQSDKKQIPTMAISGKIRTGDLPTLNSTFIELPYNSDDEQHNVSMFVILPNKRTGLSDVEANLDTIEVKDLFKNGTLVDTTVSLPKFKIESKIELNETLKKLGMEQAFVEGSFSKIHDDPELAIGHFIQKAVIEVDEYANEAAGDNVIDSSRKHDGPVLRVDRPFLVIIATTGENPIVLFTARYTGQE